MQTIEPERAAKATPGAAKGRRRGSRLLDLAQRYFAPGFVVSAYYWLKYRCGISTQARVQLSGQIAFGRGTVVKPFAIIKCSGGTVTIGRHCAVSSFDVLSAGGGDIVIGDYVRIGSHVTILGSGRRFAKKDVLIVDQGYDLDGVVIGDDVLIGSGATILNGCRIGQGAVIGAGSVVTKDVPPYAVVAGAPARVLRYRE